MEDAIFYAVVICYVIVFIMYWVCMFVDCQWWGPLIVGITGLFSVAFYLYYTKY